MLTLRALMLRHLLRRAWLAPRRAQALLARERWPAERMAERQAELLHASVLAARRRLPAHAQLPEPPSGLALFDWLRRELPLLDKRTLQQQREHHYPGGGRRRPWWASGRTSGTSGSPLELFRSLDAVIWEEAFHLQTWQWTGWRPGQTQAVLRGDAVAPPAQSAPPFWRWDPFGRQLFLSSRHLQPQHAPALLQALADSGARLLRAYPSSAFALAQLAEQQGWTARVPALVTGSEPLYPLQREQIERSLAGRVFDSYGMAERVAFAAQCEQGFHHLHPEYAWVEILDDQGQPTAGFGQLVGSSFHNALMPLLRYRLADRARWLSGDCACGRRYPRIELASGKVEDQLYDLDGHPVSASVITFAFKGLSHIRQSQVAQTDAQQWVVRLVPDRGYREADGEALLANLQRLVSARLRLSLQIVDAIPLLPSGKFKWVAQEWPAAQARQAGRDAA